MSIQAPRKSILKQVPSSEEVTHTDQDLGSATATLPNNRDDEATGSQNMTDYTQNLTDGDPSRQKNSRRVSFAAMVFVRYAFCSSIRPEERDSQMLPLFHFSQFEKKSPGTPNTPEGSDTSSMSLATTYSPSRLSEEVDNRSPSPSDLSDVQEFNPDDDTFAGRHRISTGSNAPSMLGQNSRRSSVQALPELAPPTHPETYDGGEEYSMDMDMDDDMSIVQDSRRTSAVFSAEPRFSLPGSQQEQPRPSRRSSVQSRRSIANGQGDEDDMDMTVANGAILSEAGHHDENSADMSQDDVSMEITREQAQDPNASQTMEFTVALEKAIHQVDQFGNPVPTKKV